MTRAARPGLWGRAALVALAAAAVLLGMSRLAYADDGQAIRNAINGLSGGESVYVDLAGVTVDRAAVQSSLPPGTKIAVIDVSDPDGAANAIGPAVGGVQAIIVANGSTIDVAWDTDFFCGDAPIIARDNAEQAHRAQFSRGDYTSTLTALADGLANSPAPGTRECSTFLADGSASPSQSRSSSGSGWMILAVLVALGALLMLGFVIYRKRSIAKDLVTAKQKVMPYYTRLAQEILGFDPQGNSTALGSLADASAKYSTAGEQIEAADTVADWAQGRTTVLEGLVAMREARTALGLPEGDPIPQIAPVIDDQLAEPREITFQGSTVQGYPQYQPGAPYYWGGGHGIPGGWYATPFWQQLLTGVLISQSARRGGFGGGFGGGVGRGGHGRGGHGGGLGGGGGWRSSGGGGSGWRSSGGHGGGGWRSSGRR